MPSEAPSIFAVPEPGAVVSGGHLYNARLISALRTAGADVRAVDDREFAQLARDCTPGRYFVDTLYLTTGESLPIERLDAWLIVHHLESLAPPPDVSSDEMFEREAPALRRFRGFLVTSDYTRDYLVRRGFPATSIVVVFPGVQCARGRTVEGFAPSPAAAIDGVRALLVGNLIERKQVLPLLEALEVTLRPGDRFALRIAGGDEIEPEYATACRAFAAAHPVLAERVSFAGTVPHESMPGEYAAANVFLSAARMETFGMGLQEAVAAGLPVFAVDAGFVSSHFEDGVNGRLFADCLALARGVRSVLDDPREFSVLAASARSATPQGERSWAASAQRFLAAFGHGNG